MKLPFASISSSLNVPLLFFLNQLIFFQELPSLFLEPAKPGGALALIGLVNSDCGGVFGGVIGSPNALGEDAKLSSVRPTDKSAADTACGSD